MARRLPETCEAIDPQVSNLAGLGAVVRNARAQSRLRIDDAAAFSAVSADMLSRLENGKPVTTDRLLKVLEGLGLVIDDLHLPQLLLAAGLQGADLPDSPAADGNTGSAQQQGHDCQAVATARRVDR